MTWFGFASTYIANLHEKVCNRSRNAPAGRWKKGPEVSNVSAYVARLVIVKVACIEVGRCAAGDVGPAALHAK